MNDRRSVVIGIGNEYRGDDAVGLAVVSSLRDRLPEDVSLIALEQEPTRLLDAWENATVALIVDAVASGADPGTVHRFDAWTRQLPSGVLRSSTHAFGVGDAVELARALGRLPQRVVVIGVEGASFAAGAGLSPAVENAVARVADVVLAELQEVRSTSSRRCGSATG